jgi:hypothetical protein
VASWLRDLYPTVDGQYWGFHAAIVIAGGQAEPLPVFLVMGGIVVGRSYNPIGMREPSLQALHLADAAPKPASTFSYAQ